MTGDFFIVDRRNWADVCRLGMNPAVSYLVLARGSQRDNRHSNWSVNAIKKYAGISFARGKQALDALRANLFIQQTKTGTLPQYAILPWYEGLKARGSSERLVKIWMIASTRQKRPIRIANGEASLLLGVIQNEGRLGRSMRAVV